MRDIKTRNKVNQTVKTLDRAAIVADKFRNATVKSKETAEHTQTTDETSPEEYAVNLVSDKSKIATHRAAVKFNEKGNQSVAETKRNIQRFRSGQAVKSIRRQRTDYKPWVADVYQAATGSRGSAHCALCAADMWAVSRDFSKIQVGATVYGYSSSQYGHVGIYIGNGMVAHNIGEVKIERLDEWIKKYKGFAWENVK